MRNHQAYTFTRYLRAKKSVDDRALNRQVWEALSRLLPENSPENPLHVLEVGGGIGTMLERMLEWGLLRHADYTLIDNQAENIAQARRRLAALPGIHGLTPGKTQKLLTSRKPHKKRVFLSEAKDLDSSVAPLPQNDRSIKDRFLTKDEARIMVRLQVRDILEMIPLRPGERPCDLLVAHAFLDLVDLPSTLPGILSLLKPGGLFYFTLNFDGLTLFEPPIDPALDELIQRLYHRSMDERLVGGLPSGDSRSGRHLFAHLKRCGAQVLAAGASDWIVFPQAGAYPEDEAYFLHFILHTVHAALAGHPELEPSAFTDWVRRRHAQVERGELVYIAHQIDFAGRALPTPHLGAVE